MIALIFSLGVIQNQIVLYLTNPKNESIIIFKKKFIYTKKSKEIE
jgi:hypothetical protein